MKISIQRVKQIVREELEFAKKRVLTEQRFRRILAEGDYTIGDLRAVLELVKTHKTKEKAIAAAEKTGKVGIKALIGLFPFGGAITAALDAVEPLKDIYDAVKDVDGGSKKKNKLLDLLSIDPDTSAIVDDQVEQEFIKTLQQQIVGRPDNQPIPDADELLKKYLTSKYRGAHVARGGS